MLALARARRKVNFAVRGGIRGGCHPAATVGGPESSLFFSGRSSSVSPEDEDFLAGDFLLFGLAVFFSSWFCFGWLAAVRRTWRWRVGATDQRSRVA